MRVKVFDHSGDISRYTAKSGNLSLQKRRLRLKKKKDKEKKGVLIVPLAYINKIYSNGNAEYTGFSFFHNGPGGLAEYAFAASPAKTWCTSWQPPYPICGRSCVTQRGAVSRRWTSAEHTHLFMVFTQCAQTLTGPKLSQTRCRDWKCPTVGVQSTSLSLHKPHIITLLFRWNKKKNHFGFNVLVMCVCYSCVESSRDYPALLIVIPVYNMKSLKCLDYPVLRLFVFRIRIKKNPKNITYHIKTAKLAGCLQPHGKYVKIKLRFM